MKTGTIKIMLLICFMQSVCFAHDNTELVDRPCIVQSVTESSAIVKWRWIKPLPCRLVYGTSVEYGDTIDGKSGIEMEVLISGLKASTVYYYNLMLYGAPVFLDREEYRFVTSPSGVQDPVVFAAIGETRGGGGKYNYEADHRSVIESIVRYSNPNLLIHTGNLGDKDDEEGWRRFFFGERNLLRQCPIYPVRGDNDWSAGEFRSNFAFPVPETPGLPLCYSFTLGPVYFINLDISYAQPDNYYREAIGPGTLQYKWLTDELRSQKRAGYRFTVVTFQCPLFPLHQDSSSLTEILYPLLEQNHVDMVLNGGYREFIYMNRNSIHCFVTGGGGAVLEKASETDEDVKYSRSVFHHLRFKAGFDQLSVEAVDTTGEVFFTQIISAFKEKQPQPQQQEQEQKELKPAVSQTSSEKKIPMAVAIAGGFCVILVSSLIIISKRKK